MTRLQARISSLERAADRQNHTLSLSALPQFTPYPEHSSSAHSPPSSPRKLQTAVPSSKHSHATRLLSPCSSPAAHTHLQPSSGPYLFNKSESHQTCGWSSIDSSLDLPLSLKATLREALSKQPWESSSHSSASFPDTVDHSWQGLSAMEATATSDHSFNPLTYMVDEQDDGNLDTEATSTREGAKEQTSESGRESVCTLVGEEEAGHMSTLTGMLRFVNQTLAMQEDPSLWSSTGRSETGRSLPLQVITPPLADLRIYSVNQSASV